MRQANRTVISLLALIALAVPVLAQDTFEEVQEVAPVEGEGRAEELVERASAQRIIERRVSDGRYLIGVRGRLERTENGRWLIHIENTDELGIDSKRMWVQPSTRLMEMARIIGGRTRSVVFDIRGQVFLYRGENYLLPWAFDMVRVGATNEPESAQSPDPLADSTASTSTTEDVDAMLDALEPEDRPEPRGIAVTEEAPPQEGSPIAPLKEGTMIISRTGRLLPRAEGGWEFRVDTDADSEEQEDPPVTMLPCALLERMELEVEQQARQVLFTVSGTVLVYQGENYLLPTMMLIEPGGEGNLVTAQ